MIKLLLSAALVLSAVSAQGQTVISLDKSGTLSEKISNADKYNITSLKISGPLNGTDFILLRDMAGLDQDNNVSEGKLENLDLSDASIVKGGEPYYVSYKGSENVEYYTTDNEMSNAMFFKCGKLKEIKMPATVTAIGDSCFYKCASLQDITIPNSVKEIRSYAFAETALPKFDFPEGVAISKYVLSGCSSVKEITVPSDATEIPDEAFSGTGITEIQLPSSLVCIGSGAFSGSTLTNFTCPDALKSIKDDAFSLCEYLAVVKFNSKLEEIGKSAFYSCALTEVNVPNSVKTLGGAFSLCKNLVKAHIPDGLTEISSSLFDRCEKLTEVNIPENITRIGELAFQNNARLANVKLPETLTEIDHGAFKGCEAFTEIKLPSKLTTIGKECFNGCEGATIIDLSPAMKEIPHGAFGFCTSVNELDVPEGVESIGNIAFVYCENMTKLTLPSTLNTLQNSSFASNENLAEIYCYAVTPPTCGRGAFSGVPTEDCILYVPKGSKDAYAVADTWSEFTTIKEVGTTNISGDLAEKDKFEVARYNSLGQLVDNESKGIMILRYSDGTSVKVLK